MKQSKNRNIFIAEVLGTFFLVLMGCGSIVIDSIYPGNIGHGGIAVSFGLIVMVQIYAMGNISGAHMNPAVTMGFIFAGRMKISKVWKYIPAQLLGSLLAGLILYLAFPNHPSLGATLPKANLFLVFFVEVLLTALLMIIILNVSTGHLEKGIMAGVAVGGTIALEALIGGPISGASMNPFRSLAPAIFAGNFSGLWIYLSAPFVGVLLASPCCKLIQGEDCCMEQE